MPIKKHATQFGVTSDAVERGYYESPKLNNITLKEYDGKTPGIATYEIDIEDGVGVSTIYLVYKHVLEGTSFTVYLNLENSLQTGIHEVNTYFPSWLALGEYHLSYVGLYNGVGLDAGYNRYYGTMVGYGKCDWLNIFTYAGEADLNVEEQSSVSPIKTEHIMKKVLQGMQNMGVPFVHLKVFEK